MIVPPTWCVFINDDPSASLTEMRPMTMMLYIACCWPICSQGAISALLTSASGSHLTLITEINDRRPLLNLKSANHAKSIFGSNASQVKFPFFPIWGNKCKSCFTSRVGPRYSPIQVALKVNIFNILMEMMMRIPRFFMIIPIDEDETVTWVVAFQPMQLKVNPLISPSTFF